MTYKQLFIWVEGPEDERFVEKILKPCFQESYNKISVIKYSQKTSKFKKDFISSIIAMGTKADYFYLADIDSFTCITTKKNKIKQEITNIDTNKIIVVCKEIESWYYAGLDKVGFETLGIPKSTKYQNTDNLTKEQFNQSIPKKFDSRIIFLLEILNLYNLENVIENKTNQSLMYLINKHCQ
ncbi:hypothetical protein [Crocosphaera sp. XPORK-15E]|uniref:hypothetical protein n=1 Tax=Crocosphaera sp. XPORK-15E TaxID=3110247 RepID=UPI002B1FB996|nr:hypothetical protein [Crocosphaera sp. XPORK-15E]MEA5537160.1 hypothetical protein [Crocosphaera sp. XPORK-15E]